MKMKHLAIALVLAGSVSVIAPAEAQETDSGQPAAPSMVYRFKSVTQGPVWPPSALVDADGNYVVVGNILEEIFPGVIIPVFGSALVSKDSVPPLVDGVEDFSDPFAAPYNVIRTLDLSAGSDDLNIELFSSSFGPAEGDFGGGPRIPKEGITEYNLNSGNPGEEFCPEQFPSESQRFTYTRDSYPLHRVPIWGFRGDDVDFDADTGETIANPDENRIDDWPRQEPITLGDWMEGDSEVGIRLIGWNEEVEAYTGAVFRFRFRNLLPNSVYHISLLRTNILSPRPKQSNPDPINVPNIFISDSEGGGRLNVVVDNPFPAAMTDDAGLRVIGIVGAYHSDFQNWGACPGRFGSGVDTHAFISTFAEGVFDLTDFVTKEAP